MAALSETLARPVSLFLHFFSLSALAFFAAAFALAFSSFASVIAAALSALAFAFASCCVTGRACTVFTGIAAAARHINGVACLVSRVRQNSQEKCVLVEEDLTFQRASTRSAGEPVAVRLQAHACHKPKTVADMA
ncbi:MAG TPA: hypothetical protein VIJ78_07360 [Pseudolabrys sp.]